MMYRIVCAYRPDYKRADGGDPAGPIQGRFGAWVVDEVWPIAGTPNRVHKVVTPFGDSVGVASVKPRRVGTRVNPRLVLQNFLDCRRQERERQEHEHGLYIGLRHA